MSKSVWSPHLRWTPGNTSSAPDKEFSVCVFPKILTVWKRAGVDKMSHTCDVGSRKMQQG